VELFAVTGTEIGDDSKDLQDYVWHLPTPGETLSKDCPKASFLVLHLHSGIRDSIREKCNAYKKRGNSYKKKSENSANVKVAKIRRTRYKKSVNPKNHRFDHL